MTKKSVISLISYDAELLPDSIKTYYSYVDEIILGLDKDRITWSGNSFTFDQDKLWDSLKAIDKNNKISIIEDNFHKYDKAIDNDHYERNFLKHQCSHDWILSIDADEYLLNPTSFFMDYLPIVDKYKKLKDVCMTWVTPYKVIKDKVLLIANEDGTPFFGENQGVLTDKNSTYVYARWTDKSASGENRLMSPLVAIHWSLARDSKALLQKITNTGHSDIANTDPFYKIWEQVTLENYNELRNFKTSGLGGAQWPRLIVINKDELNSFISSHLDKVY